MGKTCCPSGAPEVTMVNVGGVKVGLIAVGEIFKKALPNIEWVNY